MKIVQPEKLVASVLICLAAGWIGSIFTLASVGTWYQVLRKPSFSPPDWVFGPVWTALYVLMAVALYLVWRKGWASPGVKPALILFAVQLLLNVLWTFLFFRLRSPVLGLVDIVCLLALIVLTAVRFRAVSPAASLLLIPYVLWVAFASLLNFSIFRLNP